jgi:prepilin-type N-terminal cleavage/methylation domain-containing protein
MTSPYRRPLVRARRGVTLMELIIALTVTAVMAALGTTAFSAIIDGRREIRTTTEGTERSAALRETLRQWLLPASVQIQQGGGPRGRTAATARVGNTNASTRTPNGAEAVTAAATSEGDEIIFTTTSPNPANAPNARMRLFVDTDDATPEYGLTLEYQATTQTPLQRVQLDSTVHTMTVEYLDRRTNRWYPASEASTITVKGLRLTLLGAEGTMQPPLMGLPLVFFINTTGGQAAAATRLQ